jgi:hypothetical protein
MITAKVVIKDKFWILQRDGASVGTLRFELNQINVMLDEKPQQYADIDTATTALGIGESVAKVTSQLQGVFGYPTDLETVYNIREEQGLPCYTKSKTSSVLHAAGWYGMHRNGLHAEAFCPKFNTLENYPYIGPYRSQTDLRVAMISWKRNDQAGHNSIRQVSNQS